MEIIRKSVESLLKTIMCSRKKPPKVPEESKDLSKIDNDLSFEYCPSDCSECSPPPKKDSKRRKVEDETEKEGQHELIDLEKLREEIKSGGKASKESPVLEDENKPLLESGQKSANRKRTFPFESAQEDLKATDEAPVTNVLQPRSDLINVRDNKEESKTTLEKVTNAITPAREHPLNRDSKGKRGSPTTADRLRAQFRRSLHRLQRFSCNTEACLIDLRKSYAFRECNIPPLLLQRILLQNEIDEKTSILSTGPGLQVELKQKYLTLLVDEVLSHFSGDKYAPVLSSKKYQVGYFVSHRSLRLLVRKNYVTDEVLNAFLFQRMHLCRLQNIFLFPIYFYEQCNAVVQQHKDKERALADVLKSSESILYPVQWGQEKLLVQVDVRQREMHIYHNCEQADFVAPDGDLAKNLVGFYASLFGEGWEEATWQVAVEKGNTRMHSGMYVCKMLEMKMMNKRLVCKADFKDKMVAELLFGKPLSFVDAKEF